MNITDARANLRIIRDELEDTGDALKLLDELIDDPRVTNIEQLEQLLSSIEQRMMNCKVYLDGLQSALPPD